ncbi:hypothetical protein F4782DRAFT_511210 [Xylaria castorea]|nr:hypothetical protein F4782DRAFT_511210 [Xylaria castorea]
MRAVTTRILTYLHHSKRYIDLELAWADTVPDDEWSRDAEEEYWQCKEELDNLPEDCIESRREEHKEKLERLKRECSAAYVPKFPLMHTCLLLGAVSSNWNSTFLHRVGQRPWNSAPDWGGQYMWEPGCTVIDLSERSYAFVLPEEKSCCGGDDRPYPALRPISAHRWLSAFDLHDEEPEIDEVWDARNDRTAPVMSKKALQEVWPSFLRDETQNEEEGGDDENKDKNGKAKEVASASKKRERGTESVNERVWSTIEALLKACPALKLAVQKRTKSFLPLLGLFTRDHPERFAAECSGAVPLLLAALTHGRGVIKDLELNKFIALSGDQVVELVKGVDDRNKNNFMGRSLERLDLSYIASVTPDHVARILDVTRLKELTIWDNPGLPLEEVATVADGRIAKVTSRAGFLAPLEKWVMQMDDGAERPARARPAPPTAPTQTRIRQVVWMTLVTTKVDASAPPPPPTDVASHLRGPLSLEDLDAETLATMLHPRRYREVYSNKDCNCKFAELVALPHHDTWGPLAEFYTSLARIEKFMSHSSIINNEGLSHRWPWVFPLMMATGNAEVGFFGAHAYVFK